MTEVDPDMYEGECMEEGIPPDAAEHAGQDEDAESKSSEDAKSKSGEHGTMPERTPEDSAAEAASPASQPPVRTPELSRRSADATSARELVQGVTRESMVRPELPTRPPPERPSQTSTVSTITAEILSRSWTEAKAMLLATGLWSEPSDEFTDPEFVVGKRVWIDGQVREPLFCTFLWTL